LAHRGRFGAGVFILEGGKHLGHPGSKQRRKHHLASLFFIILKPRNLIIMVITQKEIAEILAIIKQNEECQNPGDIIRKYKDWSSSEDGCSFSQIENGMIYDINFDDSNGEGALFIGPEDATLYLLSNPANAEHLRGCFKSSFLS
jgi:hypothetical protein